MVIFKRSHLFQAIILGIHVSFRGCIPFFKFFFRPIFGIVPLARSKSGSSFLVDSNRSHTPTDCNELYIANCNTHPKFNIAPEKWWLEDYFPIGKVTFQGPC